MWTYNVVASVGTPGTAKAVPEMFSQFQMPLILLTSHHQSSASNFCQRTFVPAQLLLAQTLTPKCCLTSQHARLMSEMTAWHFGIQRQLTHHWHH